MYKQKRYTLRAINLINEKRCGKIKGRTCVDGSKQRSYIPKEETSSPAIGLEAFFELLLIDVFEDRSMQTFDVPGAYLHADLPKDKNVYMRVEVEFVEIMCEVNLDYAATVTFENGKKVFYVKNKKAIYGMVASVLLWYELFSTTLQNIGFTINTYDKCLANKMVNGKKCTMAWYVDDIKITPRGQGMHPDS